MAARPNNRSPSPLSSRPMLVNPNPRISETNPTIRRSFSGPKPSFLTNPRRLDPTTPANSPSDFAARRSVGREGIASHLRECEEKENDEKENALRASKLQSPAKGCKNFMAPTISAASKFTPSPRKKVLVERNDPVRTSISFSDGKAMFFSQDSELKSELGSDSNLADSKIKKAAVEVHPVSKPCKKVTFSEIPSEFEYSLSYESVITDSDSLNLVPPPSPIAPLDADPSLPPYDPKTNYLSPRPQFIRYRPNPRVEILKTLDPKEFDDTLMAEIMSEGLSDTDEGTDESLDKEEIADMVIGMDEEIVEARVAESLPVSTTPVDEEEVEVEEEAVVNNEKKSRGLLLPLSRFMCFSMILLLLVAGVSVSVRHAPLSFDQLLIKDLSFANLSRIYEQSRVVAVASARLSFEGVFRHVHHVSAKSVSLILKLVNEVVEGGEKQVVPLKFMNLTDLEENSWKEEGYFLKRVENLEYEEDDLDGEMEYEFEEDEYADEEGVVVVEDDGETDALEEYADEKEEEYAVAEEADSVMATRETVEEEFAHSEFQEADSVVATFEEEVARLESEYAAAADSQTTHQVEEAAAVMEEEKSQAHVKVGASDDAEKSLSTPMAEATPAQVRSLGLAVVACSVFAAVVGAAALAFVYENKRRIKEREDNNGVLLSSSMSKSKGMEQPIIHQEKEISERWETESEMSSSYHQSRSYANKKTARKYSRRESLASSSGGGSPSPSPSYGSFTTYERIPVKINNGYGEDEIITPVRRSSRIRNQVTSPAV